MTNGGTYRYQNDEYNHQVGLDIEPIKNWVTHAIFNYRTSHNESHTDVQHTYLYNLNGEAYDQNNFTYVGEDYYKEIILISNSILSIRSICRRSIISILWQVSSLRMSV